MGQGTRHDTGRDAFHDRPDRGEIPRRGVMWIARGADHVAVARRSAASVARHNPALGRMLWCDREDVVAPEFDIVRTMPEGLVRAKIDLLPESPFAEMLYLDNDTMVRADLSGLFDVLERFEMAGAQVVLWHRPTHQRIWRRKLPEAFPQINCGVLLYRNTPRTADFFRTWSAAYAAARAEAGIRADQVSFRECLWESDIRFHVLPPQFNKRVFEASELIYSDQPAARILHLPILTPQKNPLKRWLARFIR